MSEITCPYCCEHFQPTRMVFRLRKSLKAETPVEGEDDKWKVGGRSSGAKKIIDENLKRYYMNFESMDEKTADQNASFDAEAIEINFADMMNDISDYNQKMYEEHKFVLELTYKGQRLTQRLCPYCHMELIPNAGLYDMKIIAMYGDTNAGKTVYLNILEAVLRGDPRLNTDISAFQGSMFFQGNDKELELHDKNYNLLLGKHRLPEATKGGIIVKPQVFRYCYKTADKPNEDKNLLIVFRDIPGEDIRSAEKLHRYGFYLKNADGIVVLIDATKLTQVIPYLHADDSQIGNLNVSQALGNLSDLLTVITGGNKINTPTAVVLAKADVLSRVLQNDNAHIFEDINSSNANNIHVSHLDRKEIKKLNGHVKGILGNLHETNTIINPVEYCFSDYSYFAISALGEDPKKDSEGQYVTEIRPMRVAEPLYWILAKLNHIPYFHYEKWVSNRGATEHVKMFYYDKERNGVAQKRFEDQKNAHGIKDKFFGPKWNLADRNDSF